MKAVTLMYHDIVPTERPDGSGFPGPDAARYKISPESFEDHLAAVGRRVPAGPTLVTRISEARGLPLLLTFDDGGAGALQHAAGILERHGWRGHFLVTAAFVGKEGFLDAEGIRQLVRRGHIVGSHSMNHPMRMSTLSREDLVREWTQSLAILSGIIGEPVRVASIPGGYYSRKVAETAARAGVTHLFTSEPVCRVTNVEGCMVIGRFTVQRGTSPAVAAAIAGGAALPMLSQRLLWDAKKVAKVLGGELYLTIRSRVLGGK